MEVARNIDNIDRPQGLEVTVSGSINTHASNSDQVWNRKAILIRLLACSPHLFYHQILFILPPEGVWNQPAFLTTVPLLTHPGTTATVSDCPPHPDCRPPPRPSSSAPQTHTAARGTCENVNRIMSPHSSKLSGDFPSSIKPNINSLLLPQKISMTQPLHPS